METFFQWSDGNLLITNFGLMLLCTLPGIIVGFRRGWQEEGFTAIGLGIAVTGLGARFGEFLIYVANRLISVFPIGVAIILGRELPSPGEDIIDPKNPWAQLAAFALIVLVTYRAGTILGRRRGLGLLGKLAGSLFGAMNVILILARVFEIYNPLEQDKPLPRITFQGMPPDTFSGFIYGMIGLIIGMFLLLAWFNRRRARE